MYVTLDSERLQQLRARRGWSREQLSLKVGCAEKTIEHAETGKRVRTSTASEIAEALQVEYEDLLPPARDRLTRSGVGAASSGSGTAGSAPPVPDLLVGRDKVIAELKQKLIQASADIERALRIAIYGWPGVGKSTLAAALAHDPDMVKHFVDGVLWITLGQEPKVLPKLEEWGRALGTDEVKEAQSPAEATRLLASLLQNQRRFIVIDDVWNEHDATPFLVGGRLCATLVTTRAAAVAERLAPTPGDAENLEVLDVEAALQLLSRHAPDVVAKHPDDARQLVEALERLPLAIEVAGRLLNTHFKRWEGAGQSSVQKLLGELTDAARLLEEHAPANMVGLLGETKPTIAALLKKSTDYLDEETRDHFAYLSEFAPKPATFSLDMMAKTWLVDEDEARGIADRVIDQGLLQPVSDGRFWIHALLVSFAETLVDEE